MLSNDDDASAEERLEQLRAAVESVFCEDALQHRTELRKKTYSNGSKHYVQQCMRCGEQVGNPVRRPDVEPADFDLDLENRHNEIMRQRAALLREQSRALAVGDPPGLEDVFAARNMAAESIDALLAQTSEEVGEAAAMQLFSQRLWAIQKKRREELASATDRFTNQQELSAWLKKHLEEDFVLREEVRGAGRGQERSSTNGCLGLEIETRTMAGRRCSICRKWEEMLAWDEPYVDLGWVLDPLDQRRESRVVAQILPARIKTEPNQPVRAFLESPVEPAERLVLVTQAGMHQCDAVRGDEALPRQRTHFAQHGLRLPRHACHGVGEAARGDEHRPVARHAFRNRRFGERCVEAAHLEKSACQP